MTRIYVASSWRNEFQPGVVAALREDGHDVYDFKSGGGFHWSEIDGSWKDWVRDIPTYLAALNHPHAEWGFARDMGALESCDVCVYVMPCGVSASLEAGWAVGAGKRVFVYIPGLREPDLMVKMAELVTDDFQAIREAILNRKAVLAAATRPDTTELRALAKGWLDEADEMEKRPSILASVNEPMQAAAAMCRTNGKELLGVIERMGRGGLSVPEPPPPADTGGTDIGA